VGDQDPSNARGPHPGPIRLRYAATCATCGAELPAGSKAIWDRAARAATCSSCLTPKVEPPSEPRHLERGEAGASTAREYKRRHKRREEQAGKRFGRLSGVYLAVTNTPQSTQAWAAGSVGERRLGEHLRPLDDDASVIILHDRHIPGSRANIDHIAITRSGIFAIDAKNYAGKVQRIDKGGWFSTDLRLFVGRRDCTKLVTAMSKQMEALRRALNEAMIEEFELTITPVLCFVAAEWKLFARPFQVGGVWVEWPSSLSKRLTADGPLPSEHVRLLAKRIAAALPPA
jgi:hypothetical protein